ncbi:MAG: sulfite exporter TauE/SafE family protein [Kiritimatiellae bacterium]|nr:sulfite exporter TauE/SafE family protein [Kiritimatiellia bacterium]
MIIDFFLNNWIMAIGSMILGACSGILSGLFGVGGGFIIAPALNIFLGLPYNLAIGTSTCQIIGASGITLYRRAKALSSSIYIAALISIGVPFGAFFGVRIVTKTKDLGIINIANKALPAQDFYFSSLFFIVLFLITAWLFFDNFYLRRHKTEEDDDDKGYLAWMKIPPMRTFHSIPHGQFSVTLLILIGFGIGFLRGLLGIGGVVIMPVLFYLVGQKTKYATLTSTILVFVSAVLSSILHGVNNNINYTMVIFLVCGAIIGSRIGVALHHKISGKSIRKYFAFVVLTAVIMIGIKLTLTISKAPDYTDAPSISATP